MPTSVKTVNLTAELENLQKNFTLDKEDLRLRARSTLMPALINIAKSNGGDKWPNQ